MEPFCVLVFTESPVFISHPHFFNADHFLLSTVLGLSPNEDDHGLFIDIHPVSQVPQLPRTQTNDTS